MADRDSHGTALSYPYRVDERGTFAVTSDPYQIVAESIVSIAQTRRGERILVPDYGLPDFVFEPITALTGRKIAFFLEEQAKKYEPLLTYIKVTPGGEGPEGQFVADLLAEQHKILLSVNYNVRGGNAPRNLVFPFWTEGVRLNG